MGLGMVHLTADKNPTESPHCKTLFTGEIQNGRHYARVNIYMDLVLELSDLEIRFKCPFQLNLGWQFYNIPQYYGQY